MVGLLMVGTILNTDSFAEPNSYVLMIAIEIIGLAINVQPIIACPLIGN